MSDFIYVIAYDIGTTSAKTCLYLIDNKSVALSGSASADYPLHFLQNGGVEQDPEDWWKAICVSTEKVLQTAGVKPEAISGISFCSQMQGLVLVDSAGKPLRPAMSYMDQRAVPQRRRGLEHGLRIAGMNAMKLLPSLFLSGGISASVKDPVWKYHWVRENEPGLFGRVYKWLDCKEYLIRHCTGRFVMTPDSANATFLYDTRPGHESWSPALCNIFDVDIHHMPEIVDPAEVVGPLLPGAALELGLKHGTPVIGGGGDLSMISLGSGAVGLHDTHVYIGTSGWVSAVTDQRVVDTDTFIASILGARKGYYNYISEQETAGKCMEWVKDHLALDAIDIYLSKKTILDHPEAKYTSLFDYMNETIEAIPPGSGGVIFTPWLHGNRSPFEDSNARGMFFNIGLDTGKRALIRSVVEGIAFHNRWQLSAIRKKVRASGPIRFVGGGARSVSAAKIMADILDETIETTIFPQNAGALGAAILCAKGLGFIRTLGEAKVLIPVNAVYEPRPQNQEIYDKQFEVFKNLYYNNRENFRQLNQTRKAV